MSVDDCFQMDIIENLYVDLMVSDSNPISKSGMTVTGGTRFKSRKLKSRRYEKCPLLTGTQ